MLEVKRLQVLYFIDNPSVPLFLLHILGDFSVFRM